MPPLTPGMLSKLSRRTWRERWLLLDALAWLGVMRLALLALPFRRIVALARLEAGASAAVPNPAQAALAQQIGWAVRAMARYTPWQSACLVQALAGIIMLRRRGIPANLYLGVARATPSAEADSSTTRDDRPMPLRGRQAGTVPDDWTAHAWLCCGEAVLTGAGVLDRFRTVAVFRNFYLDILR